MGAAVVGRCIHTFEICRERCAPCSGGRENKGKCPYYRAGQAAARPAPPESVRKQ